MRSLVFAAGGFLNPEDLLRRGGLLLLTAIIFAESGLFFGFFLPGDSLLFIAGFLTSDAGGHVLPPLPVVLVCVSSPPSSATRSATCSATGSGRPCSAGPTRGSSSRLTC